jgi:hypothetical protein
MGNWKYLLLASVTEQDVPSIDGRFGRRGGSLVPSFHLYPHLTDRIGNIKELQPYFYFWRSVGQLISKGLLAVIEVEQDGLFKSTNMRDFIPTGEDGNALRVASRKTKDPRVRKRAKGKA